MHIAPPRCSFLYTCCFRGIVSFIFLFFFTLQNISADEADDKLRIAAIFSQSGLAALSNAPLLEMTQFSVDLINDNGGISGKEVELISIDNESTPIGSAFAAKMAVEFGVSAVIGGHWSSHSLAMAPILQKAGIPMISPSSTNPQVTKEGSYIFRICFTDSFQGLAMAQFARNQLKVETAAVLSNIDEKYSTTLAEYFRTSFVKAGGRTIADIGYRGSAIDFADIIKKLKRLAPEVVYIPGYTRDSGLFMKQARQMGLHAIFLGGDAWGDIAPLAGAALDGSYQTVHWHEAVPYAKSAELMRLYREKFSHGIRGTGSILAFDAVMILKEAIETCRCTSGEEIRDSLLNLKPFQGVTGVIDFNENGDPENKEVIVVKYKGTSPIYMKAVHQ